LQQRGGNFKTKITGLSEKRDRENCVATAGCVRAAYRAAHKNKYHNVVSCIFGGKYTLQGC